MAKKSTPASGKGSGYKNPPQHSQWKKGQSGNPSGKTSKPASIEAKLKKLAAEGRCQMNLACGGAGD
ncbi:DUF5681 domain-containing protein [Defluviimonas aestuarii]|uniref:DUF5681 domain-containing protein n=1 Tax=Albidovulum aestuarii TaxID=1130726 RepID=UPI00249C5D0C|nr:DUF5681 domain-containing protein [Defluviimonas aestuarii]MDI3334793.1 DUF5681 domain-containing protein [Defluviimonas aestuarii]